MSASPLGRLAAWADEHAKEFEVIAQTRNTDAPAADRALDVVRRFIVERGLILYGGQAIDFALRLKGSGIYPPHQTPDYDFFSPRSVDDAYELADRLVAAGFPNVGAIPAIHVQTMRVVTDFIYVADISYAPPEVFDRLPTVSYAGMRVLHPDYQRTDMHLALCFPFNNPPREDIFHRYAKDLKRFRLFQELYPVADPAALNAPVEGGAAARRVAPAAEAVVDLARVALHGFAAYAAYWSAFAELEAAARAAGVYPADLSPPAEYAAKITLAPRGGLTAVRLESAGPRIALATPWPDEVVAALAAGGAAVEWFAAYMDSRPLMARVAHPGRAPVEVHSTRNRLLAVAAIVIDGIRATVATPQYVLLNFLYEAQVAPDAAARALYVNHYAAALSLLEAGGRLIAALRSGEAGSAVAAETYRAFVESSPFGLPVQTLGDTNWDASYLIRLAQSAAKVGDEPPGVDPADLPDLANVPARYYPGGKHTPGEHPPFEYGSNAAFQRAGQRLAAAGVVGGAEGARPRRTYLALLEELDGAVLERLLRADARTEWVRVADVAFADLVVADGKYNWDRRAWAIRAGLKSRLNAPGISNKLRLHKILLGAGGPAAQFIPETIVIPSVQAWRARKSDRPLPYAPALKLGAPRDDRLPAVPGIGPDSPWIWRPEKGWGGAGVQMFTRQADVNRAVIELARPDEGAVLTRYVRDPACIIVDGTPRKMHLRLFFVVVVGPEGRRSALYREGEIAYAREPYAARDYDNPAIHDTHFRWCQERRFPRDYPGGGAAAAAVMQQAVTMFATISRLTLARVEPYSESPQGFEVFGADLLVDAAGRVWLIEINTKPGFRLAEHDTPARIEWLSGVIFAGIAEFVLGETRDEYQTVIPCLRA